MYYPPLFTSVRPFDPRANPLEVPVGRENPLDLSVKTIRQPTDPSAGVSDADELLMLDHRKLANLAASHSLSAMGRQLIDPTLYRLGYGSEAAAVIPGLAPPFCYDRTTGVAVPNTLAGQQMMASFLQQRERCLEQQHQQALYAARNSAVAQQQAAVAAAAAAYMDPANLPLHLRNGLTQREAAAALAATRGLYAPTLPAPMALPAFSLYTEDKGAFTSLRNAAAGATASDKSFNGTLSLNGTTAGPTLDAARYAEHFQRLREQHLHQHQTSGKCGNACCTSNNMAGLGQSSVPCACCVQTPSQAALCARSPMGCTNKDPTSAATGKVCDFVQPGLSFLHRPAVTTTAAATTTTAATSSELRLSVSSLCTTQTVSEPTMVTSTRDKHITFRPTAIWSACLPSTSSGGKTAFSVPKKKENSNKEPSSHHHKEHKISGSIKDILKDSQPNSSTSSEVPRYDWNVKVSSSAPSSSSSKHDNSKKHSDKSAMQTTDEFTSRYYPREVTDMHPFTFQKTPTAVPSKSNATVTNNFIFNGTTAITTVTSATHTHVVPAKSDSGSIPVTRMPPLLEAVRPSDPKTSVEPAHETPRSVPSPQGPPPLIAVSSTAEHSSAASVNKPLYTSMENTVLRIPSTIYPPSSLFVPSFAKHQNDKPVQEASNIKTSSSSSKSPKKSSSHSTAKYNGVQSGFPNEEPRLGTVTLPKPIPQLPTHHLTTTTTHHFPSHYRPAQHQMNLQSHNGWIPPANPNVTVAPLPQPATTTTAMTVSSTTTTVTSSHHASKPQQSNFSASVQREPDYADTANVLQSLLIRSAPGMQPVAAIPPSSTVSLATSVITPTNGLPLFGLDYRYPFSHLHLPSNTALNGVPSTSQNNMPAPLPIYKASDGVKSESDYSVPKHSSKKRSSNSEEGSSSKKRLLSADFSVSHAQPKYSFQAASFLSEASEAPECPYTFIPEPPLNFSGQLKLEENHKPNRKDIAEKSQEVPVPVVPSVPVIPCVPVVPSIPLVASVPSIPLLSAVPSVPLASSAAPICSVPPVPVPCASSTVPVQPKSPAAVPLTSSPKQPQQEICCPQLPLDQPQPAREVCDRLKAIRAKRKLRKKLLARIYQQRRPLVNGSVVPPDPAVIERQLAVRYARKLLSQLTLRWAHRRYVHKWHSLKRKSVLKLKKRKKGDKVVYKIKRDKSKESKPKTSQREETPSKVSESSCSIAIPAEMKRLMVNKALGETTLHRAARLGYPEAVAYCLKTKCVSVNARDNAGYTPLHECCSRGHLDIARALLQYGADVNASAAGGIRPLHDAVENDHVEIVRLLLSYGADPTIATYSGLEPIKLARSPMMAEFLQGFFADISGEVDSRPHLPWRFWGSAKCLDPEDCGYDVFEGVPPDPPSEGEGDNDFLFEVSDSPHLPTFRLLLPAANTKAQCNYLRLNDVLRKLNISKEEFLLKYRHIEVLALPRHDFEASATCSPLLTGTKLEHPLVFRAITDRLADNSSTTDLVRLDNSIRQVLGIETISVR